MHFNPRSLAGATFFLPSQLLPCGISIHAPLRERPAAWTMQRECLRFQSTLPCGSDWLHEQTVEADSTISIHAPLRERLAGVMCSAAYIAFQSTLPCGSDDDAVIQTSGHDFYFNPRSLAGATQYGDTTLLPDYISIHAPLRERQRPATSLLMLTLFQSTLPCGSDALRLCLLIIT